MNFSSGCARSTSIDYYHDPDQLEDILMRTGYSWTYVTFFLAVMTLIGACSRENDSTPRQVAKGDCTAIGGELCHKNCTEGFVCDLFCKSKKDGKIIKKVGQCQGSGPDGCPNPC